MWRCFFVISLSGKPILSSFFPFFPLKNSMVQYQQESFIFNYCATMSVFLISFFSTTAFLACKRILDRLSFSRDFWHCCPTYCQSWTAFKSHGSSCSSQLHSRLQTFLAVFHRRDVRTVTERNNILRIDSFSKWLLLLHVMTEEWIGCNDLNSPPITAAPITRLLWFQPEIK